MWQRVSSFVVLWSAAYEFGAASEPFPTSFIEMKAQRVVALILAVVAALLTATGGLLDSWRGGGSFVLTSQHAWHDGMFLLLLAIFLLLL